MNNVPAILIIATLDTKSEEAVYIKKRIELAGCKALVMDTGILNGQNFAGDVKRAEVARAGGIPFEELSGKDKGTCIQVMRRGCAALTADLYRKGAFAGVIGIGGAQGTDIGTAAMRELPFGVPKFMVSTVTSGRATFGPYVGTKDIIMMHSVADIQGINFLTRTVFDNAVAAVCGMVSLPARKDEKNRETIAMSMLGTTTPGAIRAHKLLVEQGYEVVAFHQNGTGGIAMEDLIREGRFKGVLDINLHELGDSVAGGLHAAIRDYRLTTAGEMGIPQVIAPGSINYAVWGTESTLTPELRSHRYIIHNSQLTLVRLSHDELKVAAKIVAERISRARGPVHVYIPLKGLSYPDQEDGGHWDPEGNEIFFRTLRESIDVRIPYDELDMHVNDPEFIDLAVGRLLAMLKT
jgi:uncharacterized protein (UPF0261 family)